MNLLNLLQASLGDCVEVSGGLEVKWCCPFCVKKGKTPDTKYHLYINLAKQLYYCQRCDTGGKVQSMLRKFGIRLEPNMAQWAEFVRSLRFISGNDYSEKYDHTEGVEYPCEVVKPTSGTPAYRYLTNPKTSVMPTSGLKCRGLEEEQLDKYGIVVGTGAWRSRIFIPTTWNEGLTFWVARDYSGWAEDKLKYLNPTGRSRRYHIGNLDKVAGRYRGVIITEGPFSGIAAGAAGVWTFGKQVTGSQIQQLADSAFDLYYVALDSDALPQAISTCKRLRAFGLNVRMVELPKGHDPDSVDDFSALLKAAKPYTLKTEVEARLLQL